MISVGVTCLFLVSATSEARSPSIQADEMQILAMKEHGPRGVAEFILFRSGLILFQGTQRPDELLKWSQARLPESEVLSIAKVIRSPEFKETQGREFELPESSDGGSSYTVCAVEDGGGMVEATLRVGSSSGVPIPSALARLLLLKGRVQGLPSTHWQPEWIDLWLGRASREPKEAAYQIPNQWLVDSSRPQPMVLRVSGRYEDDIERFVATRTQDGAPAILDGEAVRISATAVLPGGSICGGRQTLRSGALEELEPEFRPEER